MKGYLNMKKITKRLYCLLATGLMAANCLSLNAFAWGTSTHGDLLDNACDILCNDGKDEIVKFYRDHEYDTLRYGTQSPDWEEAIPGTHYYICTKDKSEYGGYYKNANKHYSRSARTRFEEHYSTAINLYKNGYIKNSFKSLGKAIHYICDIGCPAHSGGVRYPIVGENKHANFETFGDKNCKKYMTKSASTIYDHVLYSNFETILNELGKETSRYKFAVKEANNTSFGIALEKTIPLSQQYTAAILNRFFIEANDPSTQYIKNDGIYYINISGTSMYLDSYYHTLKVYKEVKNEYQKFRLKLNMDGSYQISPIYDKSKALAVNSTNSIVLQDSSISDNAQKFKIIYYPNGSTRIVSAKSRYDYIFGKSSGRKSVTAQDFAPGNENQRFTFTQIG